MAKTTIQFGSATRTRVTEPKKYHVVMHNDDITPMDFVVEILRMVFFKSVQDATALMLDVHHKGSAIVGTYSYDIAVSKVKKSMQLADAEGYPFRLTVQPAE